VADGGLLRELSVFGEARFEEEAGATLETALSRYGLFDLAALKKPDSFEKLTRTWSDRSKF
jgi:hypothetical protein